MTTTHEGLTAAHQRKAAAAAALEQKRTARMRLQNRHETYRHARDDAQAQLHAARPGLAAAAAEALRDAQVEYDASQREVDGAERGESAAERELIEARRAVKAAAHADACTELLDVFEGRFKDQVAAVCETRSMLIGAYLHLYPTSSVSGDPRPGPLTVAQWHEVDRAGIFSCAELDVGLPIAELREVDPLAQRRCIQHHSAAFAQRLAQLERGEESSPAEKAAA